MIYSIIIFGCILIDKQISELEYKEIENLETKRREYQRELKYAKEKLLEVYKSEVYNEVTGVGETKHGLPLGRLSVKVLEIQGLSKYDNEIENINFPIKVRVVIKGEFIDLEFCFEP